MMFISFLEDLLFTSMVSSCVLGQGMVCVCWGNGAAGVDLSDIAKVEKRELFESSPGGPQWSGVPNGAVNKT